MPVAVAAVGAALATAIGSISLTTIAVNLAIGLALGVLKNALFSPKRAGTNAGAETSYKLNPVVAAPVWRKAYGHLRIGGYRVGREVEGDVLYLALLMQSWPSAGPFTLQLDGREIPLMGDPYNLAGAGAAAYDPNPGTEDEAHDLVAGNVRVWIGKGGQTGHPAAVLSECPDFATYHHWPGATVLWLALDAGEAEQRNARWPNGQPDATLTGDWSLLYDPRDGQTRFSRNAALVALDIVRSAEGFAAPDARLDLGSFRTGADVCDESTPATGGAIRRYQADGLWDLADYTAAEAVEPALQAAMATLVEYGGRWHYTAGRYRPASVRITDRDVIDALDIQFVADPAEMANTARVQFVSPDRLWEVTQLADYQDAAALAADGGVENRIDLDLRWVTEKGQAARIAKRAVQLTRAERRVSARWRASMLAAHVGARCRLTLDTLPGGSGEYECQAWSLGLEAVDADAGLYTVEVGMALAEVSKAADAWTAAEEPALDAATATTVTVARVAPPTGLALAVERIDTGDGTSTTLAGRVIWTASPSRAVRGYALRWRIDNGDGTFGPVFGVVTATRDQTEAVIAPLTAGVTYRADLRAEATGGDSSVWVPVTATIVPPGTSIAPPTAVASSEGAGDVVLTFQTPDDPDCRSLRLYVSASDFASATQVATYPSLPDSTVTLGHAPGTGTWNYYGTAINKWGVESAPSTALTETVT